MTKKVADADRVRRAYAPRGQRSQVRQTFLLDKENIDWVKSKPNISKFLNDLIRKDWEQ